tara:strand:+ start:298 stop:1671 length:1374 start_codon:yes stop_codon:yes gene_type:complete
MKKTIKVLILLLSISFNQEIYTEYIIENSDTLDVFSYQIPSGYLESLEHPILVAFHQWGGNQNSTYSTSFDEEANLRNWFFLSPYGGSANNYNHQEAQRYTELAILFLIENYSIDQNRIYMVGGSMGGASGAIYANNHLNPTKPMVAATASASGILDCERRYYEMDGNNSMTEWFGGSPIEVPFEYHRNSAVYFTDLSQSMHYNLQYTPLYLDFGSTEPHRYHAEDLYNLLQGYNQNMWIDVNPSPGHGYSVIDEFHTCNWLANYTLEKNPDSIRVNLDEPSRAYWLEANNQINNNDFISIDCSRCNQNAYCINQFNNSDTLIFHVLDNNIPENIEFYNSQESPMMTIGITGKSPLIDIISNINFNTLTNSIWNSLNQQDDIIYVNISPGSYSMSFTLQTDINQDGVWNVLDITILASFIIEDSQPNEIEFINSDINQDGILDILDLIIIINIILED